VPPSARLGWQLVYGGGIVGLMGEVADATLAAGGRVMGVIPESLRSWRSATWACTELHVVPTMHVRKQMMAERADVFIAMPGGIGTLEELYEVWTWRQLGYHDQPIGLLNIEGYYDDLLRFMDHSVAEGFLSRKRSCRTCTWEPIPKACWQHWPAWPPSHQPDDYSKV
jgi:uncharacterized protein (TIGR00730 family)